MKKRIMPQLCGNAFPLDEASWQATLNSAARNIWSTAGSEQSWVTYSWGNVMPAAAGSQMTVSIADPLSTVKSRKWSSLGFPDNPLRCIGLKNSLIFAMFPMMPVFPLIHQPPAFPHPALICENASSR
jgi:hypothetical protein